MLSIGAMNSKDQIERVFPFRLQQVFKNANAAVSSFKKAHANALTVPRSKKNKNETEAVEAPQPASRAAEVPCY